MPTLPTDTMEVCIRVDRSSLYVDGSMVVKKLAQEMRRRFGAKVINISVVYPPTSNSVRVIQDRSLHPLEAHAVGELLENAIEQGSNVRHSDQA